jgi:hypothetical protein
LASFSFCAGEQLSAIAALSHKRMSSLSPTAADIQSHLYSAFLEGKTSDIVLRVRGTWHAIYRLHRVVLIQAVCSLTMASAIIQ